VENATSGHWGSPQRIEIDTMQTFLELCGLLLGIAVFMRRVGGRMAPRLAIAPLAFLVTRKPVLVVWTVAAIGVLLALVPGMQLKGLDTPGNYAMAVGVALLCGGGVAALVVGPVFMVVRAFQAAPLLPLEYGEELLLERPASHFLQGEGRGGKLLVTSRRILFRPHRFNVQLDTWSLALDQIARLEPEGQRLLLVHARGVPAPDWVSVNAPDRLADWVTQLVGMKESERRRFETSRAYKISK
jgi:hypothetical protein